MNSDMMNKAGVPLWEKYALTVNEAADYFHICNNNENHGGCDNIM